MSCSEDGCDRRITARGLCHKHYLRQYRQDRFVSEPLRQPTGRPDWYDHAACKSSDPRFFFLDVGEDSTRAKAICNGCPVAADCLEYGMREEVGIWGGLTVRERGRLAKQRRVTPLATA